MISRKLTPLAFFLAATSTAAQGPPWDVTDTGQPFTEVEFTVTEGTWMRVDVSPDGMTLVFDMLGDIYSIPASEVGNYDRPRSRFYWELPDYGGMEWNEVWSGR